ncbi:MAG TPA: M14 family metallopeptidase [Longimicrobiales bacterium]|nr:M14 family metallopeptidase [Longimicrobiales bacterium]
MRVLRYFAVLALLASALGSAATAQTAPSPEQHFGFAMGTDKKLARWDEMLAYFTEVAGVSARVRLDTVGPTTLGNPYVVVTLSSPGNLARLDEIRAASATLAAGRISRAEAEALAADLPATAFINHNIHSTEIASSQTSVDLVYRLATADDQLTREILDNVVTVLVPSANPDGQIMVVDWYRRNVDTEYEDARLPFLYHPYAGHDNNRDYFQANLVETRYWMTLMYHTVHPQLYLDQHQMGSNGPRIFVPPYPDPMNPDVHPLQWQSLRFMGGGIVTDLQAAGKQGVITSALYRIWGQEGALTGRYHNIVALLTESASANIASPVTVTREQLLGSANRARDIDEYGFSMQMADPWWGGEWRLGDIVEYQAIAALSYLKQAARFRQQYVMGRWQMASETMAKGVAEGPYAYVISADQEDPVTAAELVRTLILQGVEVHRAVAPFSAEPDHGMRVPGTSMADSGPENSESTHHEDEGGLEGRETDPETRSFPAGSWVVLAAQPSRAAVLDLLQPVERRLLREYPGGPYLRSYDGAAYTMPLQMGVGSVRVNEPFEAPLEPVDEVLFRAPELPEAQTAFALSRRANVSYAAANRLMAEDIPVTLTNDHFIVSAADPRVRPALERLRLELEVPVTADPADAATARPTGRSRIGLYQGWAASMDEGWTRLLLERYGFDVTTLSNQDVRGGQLWTRFDVVIIPSEIPLRRLLDGTAEGDAPPEFVGGIGDEGVEALQAFVREGGTLVTLDRGDEVVLERFDIPVRDALDGLSDRDFFAPASLFRMDVDQASPLAVGTPSQVAAKWATGRAYEPTDFADAGARIRTVARWAADPAAVLMSGLLAGAEHLAGKAAVLEVEYGRGRIYLYGFRVQHRAQTGGTFRLLFNALFRSSEPRTATEHGNQDG